MATDSKQSAPVSGGTVEPANRAAVAKERFQAPKDDERGERFELRDPFTDVTYRTKAVAEIIAKAEQLGSDRFVAIAEDGKRAVVRKIEGAWERGPLLPPAKERPLDPLPAIDDIPDLATTAAAVSRPKRTTQKDAARATALERIDTEAERAAMVARLEAALKERYVIKRAPVTVGDLTIGQTEYRFRGDSSRIAFTESTFKLATDTNSPSVARSMVDVAQARNWKGLRVSGSEDFRRMVWLEASVRGVKAIGYEPNPADLDVLRREQQARQTNRIEPARNDGASTMVTPAEKSSKRGSGRKAVIAAIEAVLVAKGVPEAKRSAVLMAATEQLAQRARRGQVPIVKVYDKAAQPQRPAVVPTPEVGRARERAAPTHTR